MSNIAPILKTLLNDLDTFRRAAEDAIHTDSDEHMIFARAYHRTADEILRLTGIETRDEL